MSEIAVYVNPLAGGGRALRTWHRVRDVVPGLAGARVVLGDRDGLAEVLARGVDRLLVFGGDGTLHHLVQELDRLGARGSLAIGPVAAGTGCDFGRGLGLPANPEASARRALAAAPRAVDLLELVTDEGHRELVVNVASAGVSGLVDEKVNAQASRGALAFLAATLDALAEYRAVPCRVTVDGTVWHEGPAFLVAIANGTSFGKGMRVAPQAKLDDGLADVILVDPMPRWKLPLRLPRLYLGTHVRSPFVHVTRGREVRFEPLAPTPPFDLDGETLPCTSCRVRVLAGGLQVLA